MARPRARRRAARVLSDVGRRHHPLDKRLEHRDLDLGALASLRTLVQRGQDAAEGIHATGDVRHRDADFGGVFGRAGERDHTGLTLQQQVVGFAVAVGTVWPIPRDRARDQARVPRT